MSFVGESQLIIHNAQFDITMINNALKDQAQVKLTSNRQFVL